MLKAILVDAVIHQLMYTAVSLDTDFVDPEVAMYRYVSNPESGTWRQNGDHDH